MRVDRRLQSLAPMKCLALLLAFAAACTSTDYGAPTATTDIRAEHGGGFAPTPNIAGVHIIGSDASFKNGGTTGTGTVSVANLKDIIGALEDIEFLQLDALYQDCTSPASDAPTVELQASLTAGANEVHFYAGCSGGMFDRLSDLEQTILDKSGYTAWNELDQ